ncbi:hypothetical protein PVAND_012155 [Polypedilum vanderplanki]|uniref:Ashwin n=1 Tax=Polypedilum vanderplanki TaxID=319348 RepID=A0A9J6CLX0_POLVA|nr:hypothetical protein PVAND_012155 [Polypedilum vanderplanki]
MDNNDLLHPNLLRNDQLVQIIRERQLNINNLENLSRYELLELFKKYILPKPQRLKKGCNSKLQEVSSTNHLVNKVKRIKINHTASNNSCQVHHIELRDTNLKRNHEDHNAIDNKPKRQRIQWP